MTSDIQKLVEPLMMVMTMMVMMIALSNTNATERQCHSTHDSIAYRTVLFYAF